MLKTYLLISNMCIVIVAMACSPDNSGAVACTSVSEATQVETSRPELEVWKAGTVVTAAEAAKMIGSTAFVYTEITDELKARMYGKSYPEKAKSQVAFSDLRYLQLLHYTSEGTIKTGELVVNKAIAQDVVDIFRELYDNRYPIERMQLIDDFDADDRRSMLANNTSGFCYRTIAGSRKLSKHATGFAIDVNTLYNPYFRYVYNSRSKRVSYRNLRPESAAPYLDRSKDFPYKISANDLLVKLFKSKGFKWGGDWRRGKDYQHFEKRF